MDEYRPPSDQDKLTEWRRAIHEVLGFLERGILIQGVQAILLGLILWRIW